MQARWVANRGHHFMTLHHLLNVALLHGMSRDQPLKLRILWCMSSIILNLGPCCPEVLEFLLSIVHSRQNKIKKEKKNTREIKEGNAYIKIRSKKKDHLKTFL